MFSFDSTLCSYIINGLDYLIKHKSGLPMWTLTEICREGSSFEEFNNMTEEETDAAYQLIVNRYKKIQYGLQKYIDGETSDEIMKETFELLRDNLDNMWS